MLAWLEVLAQICVDFLHRLVVSESQSRLWLDTLFQSLVDVVMRAARLLFRSWLLDAFKAFTLTTAYKAVQTHMLLYCLSGTCSGCTTTSTRPVAVSYTQPLTMYPPGNSG